MLANAIEGVVQNGTIHLRENVSLPENTKVYVIVADGQERPAARVHSPRLPHPKQSRDFHKQIVEIPGDAQAWAGASHPGVG